MTLPWGPGHVVGLGGSGGISYGRGFGVSGWYTHCPFSQTDSSSVVPFTQRPDEAVLRERAVAWGVVVVVVVVVVVAKTAPAGSTPHLVT
jgi:hypothetical protein